MAQLTAGCIQAITNKQNVAKPCVQVMGVKPVKQGERYKLDLSDGQSHVNGMLATQKNELVVAGHIKPGVLIVLDTYICNEVQGRNIVIILECQVVGEAPLVNNAVPKREPTEMPQESPRNQPVQDSKPPYMGNQSYQAQNQHSMNQQTSMASSRFGGGSSSAPVVSAGTNVRITPIRALQQFSGSWTIKGRISNKSDIKRWDKGPTNQGQLFSITLVDVEGTEIRATFFRDAVDKFYEMLQENNVYTLAGGKVKLANRQFSRVDNEYELTFDSSANIQQVENDSSIRVVNLKRVAISQIQHMAQDSFCDVVGVALEVGDVQEFTSKAGKELVKVEVTIGDESGASIRITLWGDKAKDFKAKVNELQGPVIALKDARVSDWGGRTLNAGGSVQVLVNPDLPEVPAVRQWYESGGAAAVTALSSAGGGGGGINAPKPLTERHTISSMTSLGQGGQADYAEVAATLTFFQEQNLWYHACPGDKPKKKVKQNADGTWHCEATNETFATKETRYMMRACASDFAGAQYVNLFNEDGKTIMGDRTGDEMEQLQLENPAEFKRVLTSRLFETYIFKVKVAEETYQEVTRKKYSVMNLRKMDWVAESKELLAAIAQYN